MADQFESTSEQGLGGSLMESIKGVAVGGILFLASFIILWVNEGRVDLSEVAKKSVEVKADAVDGSKNGQFVSVTGAIRGEGKIGDPELLKEGDYLHLTRKAEMWGWIEKSETKTKKKLGGGKKKTTTVTYSKGWTDAPEPPNEMEYPEGHENPPMPLGGQRFAVEKAFIGVYPFNPAAASLPSGDELLLTPEMLKQAPGEAGDTATDAAAPAGDKAEGAEEGAKDEAKEGAAEEPKDDKAAAPKGGKKKRHGRKVVKKVGSPGPSKAEVQNAERRAAAIARRKPASYTLVEGGKYLFRGTGTYEAPMVGDVRVSYTALKPGGTATMFALLDGGELKPYISKKDGDTKVYRIVNGTRDEALKSLKEEHKSVGWMLRIVGFLCMWIGLMMFFGPINALLDIIPFLGSAGRFLIGIVMLPIAIVLSTVTILLSIIAHSPILLILVLAAIVGGGVFFYKKKKKS
jgi:hypothetical protein